MTNRLRVLACSKQIAVAEFSLPGDRAGLKKTTDLPSLLLFLLAALGGDGGVRAK